MLICCHAATLTVDPLLLKVCGASECHMIKVSTKFEWHQAIPGWIIDNFANFCISYGYVLLWPWPLTSWRWTFTALQVLRV